MAGLSKLRRKKCQSREVGIPPPPLSSSAPIAVGFHNYAIQQGHFVVGKSGESLTIQSEDPITLVEGSLDLQAFRTCLRYDRGDAFLWLRRRIAGGFHRCMTIVAAFHRDKASVP